MMTPHIEIEDARQPDQKNNLTDWVLSTKVLYLHMIDEPKENSR
jgi:hypothetical protein